MPGAVGQPNAVRVAAALAVIGVPLVGWFFVDWSGLTTLAVYWFETLVGCAFITARIAVHQRWNPRRGHFRYEPPDAPRRSSRRSSFLAGFAVTSTVFCAAHGVFLVAILLVFRGGHDGHFVEIDWRSVGFGCLSVLLFLALGFLTDLSTLRQWTFGAVEQMANQGLGRVVVVHLTLILGFFGIAVTGAPDALFGIFVILKSLSALSYAVPQWQPAEPPKWLSRIMNRLPNVHPGQRFEQFWVSDNAQEAARRNRNDHPYRPRER